MRKLVLALLAIVVLCAFVSCDNTKIEDVAGATQSFIDTFNGVYNSGILSSFSFSDEDMEKDSATCTIDFKYYESAEEGSALQNSLQGCARVLFKDKENYKYENVQVKAASGTVSMSKKTINQNDGTVSCDAKNVVITFEYTDNENKHDDETATFKFNGKITFEIETVDTTTEESKGSLIIESVTYGLRTFKSITCEIKVLNNSAVFTSATCEGITIPVEALNNLDLIGGW